MGFPRRLLYDGETVALDLRPHWWYFGRYVLTGVAIIGLLVLTGIVPSDVRDVVKYPVALVILIWALLLTIRYLKWLNTYFVVTDQRVLSRTGAIARRGVEIPLARVTNIDYHQGIFERIIGTGDLDVESAGHESDTHFRTVKHPDEVQNEIYRQIDLTQTQDSNLSADAIGDAVARAMHDHGGGSDVRAKIEQLAQLRDEGHITPAEFEQRKNRLLDNL